MGNHTAGRAIAIMATELVKRRTDESALSILDACCTPWSRYDVDFESDHPEKPGYVHPKYLNYTDPCGPIGKLIAEAWGESGRDYAGEWQEAINNGNMTPSSWFEGPYLDFRKRYDFR